MDQIEFDERMQLNGWAVFEDALPDHLIQELKRDCLAWIEVCREYQIANRINESGDGTGHHSVGQGKSIDAFLDMHLFHPYLSHFFNDVPYIMHACNPVGGFPKLDTYIHKVHRDVATYIPDFNMRINMLVMLDDFTLENGATRVLPGSHRQKEKPSDDAFNTDCEPILGKAGSVVLFNSYLWHKGGLNTTARNRVALTLSFGLAFVKPQMDYARYLGEEHGRRLSDLSRQVLGYNARVPTTLDEWYKPKSERLYWANQG
ncbi:phytanoyl-CoA dioxygenase family protein [Noviherbaspirillum cavernae]|nr:phytanoyl-CoA dioxygenase family protein [Noviherbaspirillum cavernae]